MPRVLIADKLEAAGIELLREAGIEVENPSGLEGGRARRPRFASSMPASSVRSPKSPPNAWRIPANSAPSRGPGSASITSTCRPRREAAWW